jgi:predicted DNA-binding transcriptional regulator AlpA
VAGVRRSSVSAGNRLLDVDEVGAYLGLTRQAVYQRRYRGDFPTAIKVGSSLRWYLADIEAWLEASREVR